MRNGEQAAVALDIIALMDALKIKQAVIAGFDWGARTAAVIAALWPARCKALVSVSGYLIGSRKAAQVPFPPAADTPFGTNATLARTMAGPATPNTRTTLTR